MKWSLKIAQFKGIPVYIHATFLLLIFWIAASHWIESKSISVMLQGVFFVLLIFLCVVLHEFGHALTAARYNIRTRDIVLLPIGGVASLEKMPDKPKEELWVAIAGPLVNIVIAIVLFVILMLFQQWQPLSSLSTTSGSILERLLLINVFLAVFNLLPAFPMDGGRILRALLAMRLDHVKATQIAASIGQGMALLFGLLGIFGNPMLLFIAFFVWIGAAQEAQMAKVKFVFDGIPVRSAMMTSYQSLRPNDQLERAVQLILAGSQQDFPVIEDGNVVGILERKKLMDGLARFGNDAQVNVVMDTYFLTAEITETLQNVMARLQSCRCKIMPVLRNGKLVGLLTMENIVEFLMIHAALKKTRS
ncbi:MAG: site-2 protease family protein [Calditrichaeota bacterium]|nr:MAG: site-2 protease family protein [Calditrichota bacterium]